MKTLKFSIGCGLILAGVVLGLYMSLYECLFMGVVNVIDGFKSTPVDSALAAFGVVRFLCAGVVGALCFWLCAFLGSFFCMSATK